MEKFKIAFRVDKKEGFLTAVFLDDPFNDNYLLTCYEKIGQHGSCCLDWLYHHTRPAKIGSYESLLSEIKGIYSEYDIKVIDKLPKIQTTLKVFNKERV